MREDQFDRMGWVLFWVFLVLFALAALGTIGMVFLGFGTSAAVERKTLVAILIGQIAASVIGLFNFLLRRKPSQASPVDDSALDNCRRMVVELKNLLDKEKAEIGMLQRENEELRDLDGRIVGILSDGQSFSEIEIVQRIQDKDRSAVQASLGRLQQAKQIEFDGGKPAGYVRLVRG